MAQKPVLRGEVGCACVAREVSVERVAVQRARGRVLIKKERGGWVLALHASCPIYSPLKRKSKLSHGEEVVEELALQRAVHGKVGAVHEVLHLATAGRTRRAPLTSISKPAPTKFFNEKAGAQYAGAAALVLTRLVP